MSPAMYIRLWLMVFLHYYVWGAWYVTMGTYVEKTLKFTGDQRGMTYSCMAIGAMVSPFFAGIIADRFFATQRLLGSLHLMGAGLLFLLTQLHSFPPFMLVLMLYCITYAAGHGLTNTLTLHQSRNPAREFPIIMTMGSIGWIAAGLTISKLHVEETVGMFQLSAAAAMVMGLYSFTLPHTPPQGAGAPKSLKTMFGFDALELLKERSFAAFMVCSFLICIPLSFYFAGAHLFLSELQVSEPAGKMTIGQISDVVFLALLPLLLPVLRVKGILLLGMIAWAVRYGLFAAFDLYPSAAWLMYLGIAVHGMCYDFIFVMGRMYVDQQARPEIRGAAQGMHAFVTLGAGMFVGSALAGFISDKYLVKVTNAAGTVVAQHAWLPIWLIPAGLSLVLVVVFALLFHEPAAKGEAAQP